MPRVQFLGHAAFAIHRDGGQEIRVESGRGKDKKVEIKTTQLGRLAHRLRARGLDPVLTREPVGDGDPHGPGRRDLRR